MDVSAIVSFCILITAVILFLKQETETGFFMLFQNQFFWFWIHMILYLDFIAVIFDVPLMILFMYGTCTSEDN